MRTIKKDLRVKLASYLKELYEALREPTRISAESFAKKYHLDVSYFTVLLRDHYIRITGPKKGAGGRFEYHWMVGEPNLKMVDILIEKVRGYRHDKKGIKDFVKGFANRESEGSFNKRKELAQPIVNDVVDNFFYSKIIQKIVDEAVKKALKKPDKTRKVLKWRNPFYWVTK
jgi:hypothetical protein